MRKSSSTEKEKKSRCSICSHPKRKEIDKALVQPGASIRSTAHQFGVSNDALGRHVRGGHIATKIKAVAAVQEMVEANDLLIEINEIESTTKRIITEAMDRKTKVKDDNETLIVPAPDHTTALKAIDTRGKQIELKGKILGVFREKIEHTGKDGGPIPIAILKGISTDDL